MGILLDVPDAAQYLSWAREATDSLFIGNKLTSEPGEPVYFNLFWLVVGRLAVILRLGLSETTQLVRPVAGAVYLAAIFWYVGLVTAERRRRWVTFLTAALGAGFGWVYVIQKQLGGGDVSFPLDLYINEPNALLTLMAFPHQAMATGLLVLILGFAALAFERDKLSPAIIAALLAVILGVQHGYDLLVVYGVVGSTALVLALRSGRWSRRIVLGGVILAPSLPVAGYLAYLTTQSPIWRGVLAQYGNAGVFTPTPPHLLVLLGLPLVLVLAGAPILLVGRTRGALLSRLRIAPAHELMLWMWLCVGFCLLYIPTDFQVKMLAGWQVPVAVIATRVAFAYVLPALQARFSGPTLRLERVLGVVLVLAVLPTNIYFFAWRIVDLNRHEQPYYLNRDDIAGFHWLETHSQRSDVVLSSLTTGQYIPALSGNTALLAHWAQTLDFYRKRSMVARYFDAALPGTNRLEFLSSYNVHYVFYGDQERAVGSFDPGSSDYLTRVFSSPRTSIFEVRTSARSAD
jgi:hypothetical protein